MSVKIQFDRVPSQHFDITLASTTFVICENPTTQNIPEFLQLFEALNVKHLVRTSVKNYELDQFLHRGIRVSELQFDHSALPNDADIDKFMNIVKEAQAQKFNIAVQGVSGKTRSPLLVACAACECGMGANEAIQLIRARISGQVFNPDQVEFLYGRYKAEK
ncbi:Protein_tyrosine phosphatase [Hexamita inflata]|uniref:Protein tyrosine phosphatase n=1 Tax=Hexamita inflata TaxID=28002 RepID=A0AA86V713_9EUKA|nr:Protein tyrosine phosphatase [Hexamita inflata]CAI9978747.1 Protein tyrosine phosphatase [Hexamita inflata]